MNNFTTAQTRAIETWNEQRDTLLREIGVLTNQRDSFLKQNTEGAAALTDLQGRIAESKGRILEISTLEERWRTSLASDIADLEVRKSRLQGDLILLEQQIISLREEAKILEESNLLISEAHTLLENQAASVCNVFGELIKTTETHLSDMRGTVTEIKTVATEVIDKGNENVKQTNIVLGQLPRYIFELQRPIPVRRYVEALRGDKIDPVIVTEVKEANAKVNELI